MAEEQSGRSVSSGAASLRDTTKWMVGGVAATAAGVFAGSSLTHLGSLDPAIQPGRLGLAFLSLIVGFGGLAWIMKRAIPVLTVDSLTLRGLASAEKGANGDKELKEVATTIWGKFSHAAPLNTSSLSSYSDEVDKLADTDPRLAKVREFSALVMPDAAFIYVRNRFRRLTDILLPAILLAIAGFGVFAWAANPPAPSGPPPLLVVHTR